MADEDNDALTGADEGADASVQEAPQLSEVEELASEMGWRPKDQWQGDEGDWKPAKDFLKTTRDINRDLHKQVKNLSKQMEGVQRATATMTERAISEARTKWEAEHERAVEEGDTAGAKKAANELAQLDKVKPEQAPDPEGAAFAEKHSAWFGRDQEATDYAIRRAGELAKQGLPPSRQIAAVEREMKEHYPEYFPEKAPKKEPPAVADPQRTARTSAREKGYATLPPEARKACNDFVEKHGSRFANQKPEQVRDQWCKDYYEEAANG